MDIAHLMHWVGRTETRTDWIAPAPLATAKLAPLQRKSSRQTCHSDRPVVKAMAEQEQRVVLRCRPYATFAQPPRHLHRNDEADQLTHWVSAAMPWDAEDPENADDTGAPL